MTADVQRELAAPQTTAGTCGDGYRVQPQPIPRPRSNSDDPTEPGRRNTGQQEKQR